VAVTVVGLQVSLHGEVEMLVVQAVDKVRVAEHHHLESTLKVLAVVRPQMMVLAVAVVLVVPVLTVQLLMVVLVVLVSVQALLVLQLRELVAVVAVALLMVQRQPAVVLVMWLEQLTLVVVVVQERMVALE
jgi:hypothetical protein